MIRNYKFKTQLTILLTCFLMVFIGSTSEAQTIYSENFEGAWTLPATLSPAWSGTTTPADDVWHKTGFTTGWTSALGAYTPLGANSTTASARFHTYDAGAGTTGDFITPTIDLSAHTAGTLKLTFYHINTSETDVLNVYVSDDNGATWSSALAPSPIGVSAAWTLKSISLPGNSATTKIKFTATSDFGSTDIGVDEVRVYSPVTPDAAPISFVPTLVTQTGMTIGWTDNSTNETAFRVYRSTDNITFTQQGADITSTSSATTGTAYSQNQTGLLPGTTYYYRIASVVDLESPYLTGTQATLTGINYYWVGPASGDFNTAANWNTMADNTGTTRVPATSTDVLIVDGAGIVAGSAATMTLAAVGTCGQLLITNNTAVTIQSTTTTVRIITINGGPGIDLDLPAGCVLNLTNVNPAAIAFAGTGNTGNISGTLNFAGAAGNNLTTTGGTGTLVTVSNTGIVNLGFASNLNLVGSVATLAFADGANCNSAGATTGAPPVPLATWGANSNLTVTGITSSTTAPTNNSQSFGNVSYNCPLATGTMNFWGSTSTATIKGNLNIIATNTGKFRALSSATLIINGNLNVSGGNFEVSSTTGTINVLGNVNVSGGVFDIAFGGAANLKVAGNFIQTAGNIIQTNVAGTLEFNGTTSQTLTLIPGSHGTNAINAKINNNAGVNLTSAFSIRNLTVTKGNMTGAGSLTYNGTTSLLTYNGTTGIQTASAIEFPSIAAPSALTINNTSTSPTNVVAIPFSRSLSGTTGALNLTAGILDNSTYLLSIPNTAVAAIIGGSATSYVKGAIDRKLPASYATASTYNFPVGKGTYNPFALVNPTTNAGGTVTVQAEVFDANCGGTPGNLIGALNSNRYWAASTTAGAANLIGSLIQLNDTPNGADAIAASSTLTGAYDLVGGLTITSTASSLTSTAPAAATLPGYFVMGNKAAATLTNLAISPTGNQCTNVVRTITVTATPGGGAVTGVVINYSINGVAQTAISMTNTTANDWSGVIPTVSPANATITWSVTATDANLLTKTATGTPYTDEPNFGNTATASANNTTVCSGNNSILSVAVLPTPSSYSWSDGSIVVGTTNPLTVNPTLTTNYTCTVMVAGCSLVSNTVSVTVLPLPTAPIATNSTQCGTKLPTASVASAAGVAGSGIFNWYANASGGVALQSSSATTYGSAIATTTTFYVSESGVNGCESNRTPVTITVAAPPALSLSSGTQTICNGAISSAITLSSTITDFDSYTWSPSSFVTGSEIAGWTFNPTTTTTYTLTASNSGSGCANIATVVITVNELPVITSATTSVEPICEGSSTTLTALSFSAATVGTAVSGTGTTYTSTTSYPTAFENYWYQNWQQYLFKASELTAMGVVSGNITSIAFNIATLPSPNTALTDYNIKIGTTASSDLSTFTTTGLSNVFGPSSVTAVTGLNTITFSTPYNWDGVSNIIIDLRQTGHFGNGNAATYFTATSNNSVLYAYSNSSNLSYWTSNPIPVTSVSRPNITFGAQVISDLSSTLNWSWSPSTGLSAITGNIVTANPTTTTLYTVTATNPTTTCSATKTVNVTVNPKPTAPVNGNITQCGIASPIPAVNYITELNGFTTPMFNWYNAATGGTVILSTTNETLSPTLILGVNTFYVSVINPTTGCESNRTTVTITVNTPPTFALSNSTAAICIGTTSSAITIVTGAIDYDTYTWSPSINVTGNSTTGWMFNPTTTTTFTLTALNSVSGCINNATIVVTVNPLPSAVTIAPVGPMSICSNSVQALTASGGSFSNVSILNENFNGASNTWSKVNNSTGGNVAGAAWTLRADGYIYTTYGTWHSNDNSQFYMSNSDVQGSGGTTSTLLESPSFSTLSFKDANLKFWHYYEANAGTAKIQYTINAGTTWTDIQSYSATQGAMGAFVQANIVLPAGALNQANVKIRFKYDDVWGYFWGIDNVSISGTQQQTIVWSPVTNLYSDAVATTVYTGGAASTVYFKSPASGGPITYTATATSALTCTSAATVNLTVLPAASKTQTLTVCAGGSVTIGSTTHNTSGTFIDILTGGSYNGCDSTVTTNLTVLSPVTASQTLTVCAGGSVTIAGNTHSVTGVFTDVLTAGSYKGCDSTVTTNLTVRQAITSTQTLTVCAGGSVTVGSTTHTTTGTFTDIITGGAASGCDSTVTTNLTVLTPVTGSQTITVCAGGSVTVGSATHNTTGVFTDVLTAGSYNGCDSTVTTNLTVRQAVTSTQTLSVCAGGSVTVGSNTHTTTGTYIDVITSGSYNGCDSTVTTNLTVISTIDVSTAVAANVITANSPTGTYQWIDCDNGNAIITGQTSQSYTALVSGNYAVIVTEAGTCSDTSTCVNIIITGVSSTWSQVINISPNPTSGVFTLNIENANSNEVVITIMDIQGKVVYNESDKNISAKYDKQIDLTDLSKGIYFVKLNIGSDVKVEKLIVQ